MQGKKNKVRMISGLKFRAWFWVLTLEPAGLRVSGSFTQVSYMTQTRVPGCKAGGGRKGCTALCRGNRSDSVTRESRSQPWMRQAVSSIPNTKTSVIVPVFSPNRVSKL